MANVTLKGNPVKLVGNEVKVGDAAPDFKTQKSDLSDYNLSSSAGKTRILLSIPSLDTPVCDAETKRFNEEASKVPGVEIACISMDMRAWVVAASVAAAITATARLARTTEY